MDRSLTCPLRILRRVGKGLESRKRALSTYQLHRLLTVMRKCGVECCLALSSDQRLDVAGGGLQDGARRLACLEVTMN